jgi:hypothetical protein
MAVDTAAKRKSMLSFGSGDLLLHPDGTIDVGDRLTLLGLYGGIEPEEVLAPSPLYRPQVATGPAAYRPGAVGGPAAYRPLASALPAVYRPGNPTSPGG